jgi:glutamate--cysteine ligase
MNRIDKLLRRLPREVLTGIRRGVEKESLRVRPDGMLADTPHPAGLGSALTHPHITTDFSESQLELITSVHTDVDACLAELTEIHQVVYPHVGEELLWCTSMPCGLPADDDIPIGRYGSSNLGRAKTVYRQGLAHRYGRRMQTISGVHYNFSMPEAAWPILQRADAAGGSEIGYQASAYFHLIRNFRRHSWLLLYLFGASPTVCSSFVAGRTHGLQEFNAGTLFLPGATSLRMGPLGYQSDAQASLAVSFNCLRSYAESLNAALTQPYAPYQAIGLRARLPATRHDAAADRKRVLRHHPAQAALPLGGTPPVRAGRARRRVRRSALHGQRPFFPRRHRRRHDALPRHVSAALPAPGQPPGHARGNRRHVAQPARRSPARP